MHLTAVVECTVEVSGVGVVRSQGHACQKKNQSLREANVDCLRKTLFNGL